MEIYEFLLLILIFSFISIFVFIGIQVKENQQYKQKEEQINWENTPKGFGFQDIVQYSKEGQIITIQGRLISYEGNSYYKFVDLDKDTFTVKLDSYSRYKWNQISKNKLIELTAKISIEHTKLGFFNKTRRILVGVSAVIKE